MLETIGPTRPLLPLQMLPARVARPLPPAKGKMAYRPRCSSPDPEVPGVDLHDDIPPELLAIPQTVLGSLAAIASYRSNQSKWAPPAQPAEKREEPGMVALTDEQSPDRSLIEYKGTPGVKRSYMGTVPRHHSPASPSNEAPTMRSSGEWPTLSPAIEIAAPEPAGAETAKASGKKSYYEDLRHAASDAYYDLLTLLPYTADIFRNMLA